MNRKPKHLISLLLSLCLLSAPFSALFAQKKADSLFYFQQKLRANAWQTSNNPVFLSSDNLYDFAEAGVFYRNEDGNFKSAQEFLRQQQAGISASGISSYKNWRFSGTFSYLKLYKDSVKYTNTARPFSGNPFITANLKGGNWKGDQLKVNLQMLAPSAGKATLALTLDYEAEQSARTNEPKPLYRYMNYRIMPALGYALSEKSKISLTGGFTGSNEVIETGMYSRDNAILYDLRGYGTAVPITIVRSERFTTGSGWESGGDYQYKSARTSFLIGGRYIKRIEDVNEGVQKNDPSLPILVGSLDETQGNLYLSYQHENKNGWLATAAAWFRDGLGYDGYFKTVNPTYYLSGLDGRFSWYNLSPGKRSLALNFYPGLTYMNYAESAAKTDWKSTMAYAKISAAVNYKLSSKFTLTTEPLLGYYKNLQKGIIINNPSLISELITRTDFAFNTSSYLITNASVLANAEYKQTCYRFLVAYSKKTPVGQESYSRQSRNLIHTSISILF